MLTWAKQHEQRLETALTEVLNNANLLEELLSWLQWAETTLVQRDTEPLPQDIPQLKTLITEHQVDLPVGFTDSSDVCGQTNLPNVVLGILIPTCLCLYCPLTVVLSDCSYSLLVSAVVRCLWRR